MAQNFLAANREQPFLLRGSPAYLSAEELLERVWDEHADPFTNAVAVTFGRLRRKLGDPPVITTAPRVGYRIADGPRDESAHPPRCPAGG